MLAQPKATASRKSPAVRAYEQADQYVVSPATPERNDWDVIKRNGNSYRVDLDGPHCNCRAFATRHRRGETTCKHIELVRFHVAADAAAPLPSAPLPVEPAPAAVPAPRTFSPEERAKLLALWD